MRVRHLQMLAMLVALFTMYPFAGHALDNGLARTPPMGWNSWNKFACKGLNEQVIRETADTIASNGMKDAGYQYINLDDCWQISRDAQGNIVADASKFPSGIKALADYVHGKGLKIGLYTDVGTKTCAGRPGSLGHEYQDAKQWAEWGIDYLKYDWSPNRVPETAEMARALRASGRDIVYSLSNNAPFAGAADWARLANCWRTTGDIRDNWGSMTRNGFSQDKWRPYAGPGHWNDPDMLVVGDVGWGPRLHATHLTPNEQYTHISLWCLLSSPLLLGCDLEKLDPFTLSLLTNDEVLAVDQDPLGHQARQAVVDGRRQIWVKEMADGSHAICLFNLSQRPDTFAAVWSQLGLSGPQRVRDLWRQKDLGVFKDQFTAEVPRHGVVFIRVWPEGEP